MLQLHCDFLFFAFFFFLAQSGGRGIKIHHLDWTLSASSLSHFCNTSFPSYLCWCSEQIILSKVCVESARLKLYFKYSTKRHGTGFEPLWLKVGGKLSFNFTINLPELLFLQQCSTQQCSCYEFLLVFLAFCFFHEGYCHPVILAGERTSLRFTMLLLSCWNAVEGHNCEGKVCQQTSH